MRTPLTDKTTLVENLDSYSEEELHQILTQLCSSPPASKASKSESSAKPKRGFQSIPAYFGSAHRTTSSGSIIDLEQTESLRLGEMTVTAYSLVKGRNALHAGQRVRLVRPSTTSLQPTKRNKIYFHAKAASAPTNSIVRMESESNCELLGKIATETASFICKLMDFGLASFQGSIIYAPESLRIQDDIYVSLEVTLLPKAFQLVSGESQIALREESESIMKRAKVPLLLLFERLGLTPSQGNIPEAVKNELQKSGSAPTYSESDSDEIDNSRLLDIYSKAQFWDSSIKGMDPSEGMILKLRDYQRVALDFMFQKERGASYFDSKTSLSPLWLEYMSQSQVPYYFNPFTGKLTLEFPKEEHCTGGILADDMGLGKTIEILSLIHSNPATNFGSACYNNDGLSKSKATLIVCPLNLLSQWRDEILRAFEDGVMTCELYYGLERGKWPKNYLINSSCPDVILTTYGTLTSDYNRGDGKQSPLFSTHFHRVVLDEAHYIKERSTQMAKASYMLSSTNRWAVTGTPIVNKLEYSVLEMSSASQIKPYLYYNRDLYSLVHFLRIHPWCQYSFWKAFIAEPFSRKDVKALEVVQKVMEPIVLRRTKTMRDEKGDLIVKIPPKTVDIEYLDFSSDEREIYDALNTCSKREIYDLKLLGNIDYTKVFQLVLSLRLLCDHPLLVKQSTTAAMSKTMELKDLLQNYMKSNGLSFADSFVEELRKGDAKECPVCFEDVVGGVLLPACLHVICQQCIEDIDLKAQEKGLKGRCPICRKEFNGADLLKINIKSESDDSSSRETLKVNFQSIHFKKSSKLSALIKNVKEMYNTHPDTKAVIFSQWTSMLDLVEVVLNENAFNFFRLDGTMSQKKREETLRKFKTQKNTKLLLASLRSTGVGLNLTEASYVFMMDPWWNESVENQAIDRVHRLGQTHPVTVKRFIIKGSVEEKMLAIQKKKSALAGAITGHGEQTVTLEDLMGLFV